MMISLNKCFILAFTLALSAILLSSCSKDTSTQQDTTASQCDGYEEQGSTEDNSLYEEAGVSEYIYDIIGALSSDSTRTFEAEEFASVEGYIVAKDFEVRRSWLDDTFGSEAEDLHIAVSVLSAAEGPYVTDGKEYYTFPFVLAEYSFNYGEFRTVRTNLFEVMIERDDKGYSCIDIAYADHSCCYYDTRYDISAIADDVAQLNLDTLEHQADYINGKLSDIYSQRDYGSIENTIVHKMESDRFTQDDYRLAVDAVMADFMLNHQNSELLEISFSEMDYSQRSAPPAWGSMEDSMLLTGTFVSGEKTEDAVFPVDIHDGWEWVLRKNKAGGWDLRDEGYR